MPSGNPETLSNLKVKKLVKVFLCMLLVLTNVSSSWCQAEDNRCTSSLVPVLPSILLCIVGRNMTVSPQLKVRSRDWARGSLHDYNGAQTVPRPNTSLKLKFLQHQSIMGSSLGHFGLSPLMEIWPRLSYVAQIPRWTVNILHRPI